MKNRLHRWCAVLSLCAAFPVRLASAADPVAAPAPTAAAVPAAALGTPASRAVWQQHLTLGPGDILNFSLYSEGALVQTRENVVIGPDGRVSYLQARDVTAAGLTIDELRAKMNDALTNAYRSPHTVITPVAINSKKFIVLGAVVNKGSFVLDRPLTLIDAIARAGGLETGVFERSTVELADLSHSYLVRNNQRVPVDFEKLFQQGDLSQNLPLEPGDFLYFSPSSANEFYVVGEIASPGPVPFTPNANIIGAITARGSYTPKAYKGRVLVIRGSLSKPETFVVDTTGILEGKISNFRLKPKDIVYVAARPWHEAEELLDAGTQAFIEAVVVTYTGAKIGPFPNAYLK